MQRDFAGEARKKILIMRVCTDYRCLHLNILARNEITRGVQSIEKGLHDGTLIPEDVSETLLQDSFRILPSQPLDLLVRTSGETRLSDFLLWQVNNLN